MDLGWIWILDMTHRRFVSLLVFTCTYGDFVEYAIADESFGNEVELNMLCHEEHLDGRYTLDSHNTPLQHLSNFNIRLCPPPTAL